MDRLVLACCAIVHSASEAAILTMDHGGATFDCPPPPEEQHNICCGEKVSNYSRLREFENVSVFLYVCALKFL